MRREILKIENKEKLQKIEYPKNKFPCIVTGPCSSSGGSLTYLENWEIRRLIAMKYEVISIIDTKRKAVGFSRITDPNKKCDVCNIPDSLNRLVIPPATRRVFYGDGGDRCYCWEHYYSAISEIKKELLPFHPRINCSLCEDEHSPHIFSAKIKDTFENGSTEYICQHHLESIFKPDVEEWWQKDY